MLAPTLNIRDETLFANSSKQKPKHYSRKWAMVINLEACAKKPDCRDCIEACNIVHNIPDLSGPKEEVKWIWQTPYITAFPEHINMVNREEVKNLPVTVLCNHCENPPCVKVCPTKATWKREDGIVMMDYHRCIGCRYCMAACPYGARSFNWFDPRLFLKTVNRGFPTRTRGVVEKCNFCEERLVRGLMPACVEACKENALVFGDLAAIDSDVRKILKQRHSFVRKPHLGAEPKVFYIL
jgi:Fe-S-cluster-containing dehydrogenase component